MQDGHFRGHKLTIGCPHCGSRARVRSSRELTSLVRTAQFQCTDVECGHTFGAQLAITHTIAPSHKPNPDVSLPMAPPRLRPSNDNGGLEAPPPAPLAMPLAAVAAG